MTSFRYKLMVLTALPMLPVVFILARYYFYYRRGWHDPAIQLQLIFWLTRGILTPLVVLVITEFWTEFNKTFQLIFKASVGLVFFLVLQTGLSFFLSKVFVDTGDNRHWNLYKSIIDETLLTNTLLYWLLIVLFYAWSYYERALAGKEKIIALELALSKSEKESNSALSPQSPKDLLIKSGTRTNVIPIDSILHIRSDGPYVKIFTQEGKSYLLHRPLYQVERDLAMDFARIHRSNLVRIAAIKEVKSLKNGDFMVHLTDGNQVRGSRTFKENLQAVLSGSRLVP